MNNNTLLLFHQRFKKPLRKHFEDRPRQLVRSVPQQKQLMLPLQGSTGEICEHGAEAEP